MLLDLMGAKLKEIIEKPSAYFPLSSIHADHYQDRFDFVRD